MQPPQVISTTTPAQTATQTFATPGPVILKRATRTGTLTTGLKSFVKNTPAGVKRELELHDVQEERGNITERARHSTKPGQIEVRHEFFLVDCFSNPVIKVAKGQTVVSALKNANTYEIGRISHLVKVVWERPAGKSWFRSWKRKCFDTLTAPSGDSIKDYVTRLQNPKATGG